MDEERLAYLALALTPGIGPIRLRSLARTFGSWRSALQAPIARLSVVPTMNLAAATAIQSASLAAVTRALDSAARMGVTVLLPGDALWPERLIPIDDAPAALFTLGNLGLAALPAVAVVGSRTPTVYGVQVTREIGRVAAEAGLVVVSGMARGLDAVAHTAALDANGKTIGVLGNGIGVVYPAANRLLYDRVARHGLLLTEHPPGERPNAGSFPRRNRLISGLASLTVVVEAAARSGALGTADAALDQGRDVMAVPGSVQSRTSAGTNRLIRDGAAVYLEPADLLQRFPSVSAEIRARFRPTEKPPLPDELDREQSRVYRRLEVQPKPIDALAWEAGLSAKDVLAVLTELELAGLALQSPTGFARA
jgi:DNA processing protein